MKEIEKVNKLLEWALKYKVKFTYQSEEIVNGPRVFASTFYGGHEAYGNSIIETIKKLENMHNKRNKEIYKNIII